MKKKIDILKTVNENYSKYNPSTYQSLINNKEVQKLKKSRSNLFFKLKFPPDLFKNKDLLELGAGSGQFTLAYDNFGSRCTLVEYDPRSVINAKNIFKKYSKNSFKIVQSDIFKFKSSKKYSLVSCTGVAQHTKDPIGCLSKACGFVKSNGFIIFSTNTPSGNLQNAIMRYVLFKISNSNKEILKNSKILFLDYLKKVSRGGGRKIDNIIGDQFLNYKEETISTQKVLEIFNAHKISLYSNFPKVDDISSILDLDATSTREKENIKTKYINESNGIYLKEHQWMTYTNNKNQKAKLKKYFKNIETLKNKISDSFNNLNYNDFNINLKNFKKTSNSYVEEIKKKNLIKMFDLNHHKLFFKEVNDLLDLCEKYKSIAQIKSLLKKNKCLFKKNFGVGVTYYIGLKK